MPEKYKTPLPEPREPLDTKVLSTAIRQAVSDLTLVEQTKGFGVDMADWYQTPDSEGSLTGGGGCCVCFAGSALVCRHPTAELPDKRSAFSPLHRVMYALDGLRKHFVMDALLTFYKHNKPADFETKEVAVSADLTNWRQSNEPAEYKFGPDTFKQQMLEYAVIFEKHGL